MISLLLGSSAGFHDNSCLDWSTSSTLDDSFISGSEHDPLGLQHRLELGRLLRSQLSNDQTDLMRSLISQVVDGLTKQRELVDFGEW